MAPFATGQLRVAANRVADQADLADPATALSAAASRMLATTARGDRAATREVDRLAKIIDRRVVVVLLLLAREFAGAEGENVAPTAARVIGASTTDRARRSLSNHRHS